MQRDAQKVEKHARWDESETPSPADVHRQLLQLQLAVLLLLLLLLSDMARGRVSFERQEGREGIRYPTRRRSGRTQEQSELTLGQSESGKWCGLETP